MDAVFVVDHSDVVIAIDCAVSLPSVDGGGDGE